MSCTSWCALSCQSQSVTRAVCTWMHWTVEVILNPSSPTMDDALSLVCSALLISIVVWLLNPLAKLHTLLSYLLREDTVSHTNHSEEVRTFEMMPGPKGLPYFGDVVNYLRTTKFKPQMAALQTSFEKYGPIFKRTILGRTIVSVQDPSDVEIVLKAEGKYPVRPNAVSKVDQAYKKSRNFPQSLLAL